ncbi:alkaline-phosphatase-like protein [Gorgonomyces haynaldii]|nr:alkaline-phosphatase-like protein [Gorgonomyces haynaldii]
MDQQHLLTPDEEYVVPIPQQDHQHIRFLGVEMSVKRNHRSKLIVLLLGSFVSLIGFFWLVVYITTLPVRPKLRGVILMISDGFGPASQTMARNYQQMMYNDSQLMLPLDAILVGSSRTRSSSSLVTDSAAGATAFACALKSYNGAISVDPQGKPCGTVLEAAKEQGLFTGLVATSRITHATPATFSSHVASRASEADIAMQQIGNYTLGRRVDLMFGGGKCFFTPVNQPLSCRSDNKNRRILVENRLPLLGLFAPDHMNYEIDRDPAQEPSLSQMASKAVGILDHHSKKNGKGFFIMIEGSRIDMAAHTNDPAGHLHDILEYNQAILKIKQFVDQNPDTVMISVSDHETGGLSDAVQIGQSYPVYDWYPKELVHVQHSAEYLATQIQQLTGDRTQKTRELIQKNCNLTPTDDDLKYLTNTTVSVTDVAYRIGLLVSQKAGLGWATHGHSAVDVNLYAHGLYSDELRGNHDNTEIGKFIARHLQLDLQSITQKLSGMRVQSDVIVEHSHRYFN